MPERPAFKVLPRLSVLLFGAVLLAGCQDNLGSSSSYRAYAPIPEETQTLMGAKGTNKNAAMLIRAFKKESELEVWKQRSDGHYVYLKTFPMCRWSGQLGPKVRQGDRQVPEGFYSVTPGQMNPNSAYYLSFNVGYPNAYDRAWGRSGDSIMVHGICSSAGCFSMTDKQIEEIYAIVRESFAGGQHSIQMQSYPFRMTAENLAKYRLDPNMPFWRELKRGADYFEVTKLEPPVGVCNKHYVFATPKANARFDALSACPPIDENAEIKTAVADKETRDSSEIATLVNKGVKPVRIVYQDGGQHPAFSNRFADVSRPDALVAGPTEIALDTGPKPKAVAVQVAAAKANATRGVIAADVPKSASGSTVVAATRRAPADATGSVPALFGAAPSAYAKEEPKSANRSFLDKVMSLGGSDAPNQAVPDANPSDAAQPAPPVPAAPNRQAATKRTSGPQAALSGNTATPGAIKTPLDPNFLAYSPLGD